MQGLNNHESYQKFKTVIPSISIRDLILTMKVIRSLKPAFLRIPIPNPAVLHSTELYKAESLRTTSAEVSAEKGAVLQLLAFHLLITDQRQNKRK